MEPIRATSISAFVGLAAGAANSRAGKVTAFDGFESAATAALAGIASAQLPTAEAAAAKRAIEKIEQGLAAFSGADCFASGMARLLALQARQSNDRTELAKTTIQVKHDQIRARNEDELHQIKKRIEESQNKSFWSKIADIFKAIGALLSAVSSVFTGPIGIAASALCVASIVVAHTAPPEWGQWVSLGLSLASAALTFGATLAGKGMELASKAITTATNAISAQAKVVEGVATVASAVHGYGEQSALADIAELRALRERLQADAKEEQEMVKLLTEATQRGTQAVVKALNNHNRAALAACRAGA
jgi:hypothetical protein